VPRSRSSSSTEGSAPSSSASPAGGTRAEDHVPADPGSGRGLYALDAADSLDVLRVPDLCAALFDLDEKRKALVACLTYCRRRRAMLIVDPPREWDSVAAVRKGVSGATLVTGATENAALHVHVARRLGPGERRGRTRPPSAAVAGVWARTDATRGVWHAPAGTVSGALDGVAGLTVALTVADVADLARSVVNCQRDLPGVGSVVWGARTLHDQ
jgi:phage tail sheath protein FI